MAYPHLALRPTRNGLVSHYIVTGSKNPLPLGMGSVKPEGYPYAMPMNHFYDESTETIYFHGGKYGWKIDALRENPKVSFCVMNDGEESGSWYRIYKSVIVFGQAEFIDSMDEIIDISTRLSLKFTDDRNYIENEIEKSGNGTLCIAIRVEHMSGKVVNEK